MHCCMSARFCSSSCPGSLPASSLKDPRFCIFSHSSLILLKPSVAAEPFRKWPKSERVLRSLSLLPRWISIVHELSFGCGRSMRFLHGVVHLFESIYCLLEESEDYRSRELTVNVTPLIIFIHFKDLFECWWIDIITEIGKFDLGVKDISSWHYNWLLIDKYDPRGCNHFVNPIKFQRGTGHTLLILNIPAGAKHSSGCAMRKKG